MAAPFARDRRRARVRGSAVLATCAALRRRRQREPRRRRVRARGAAAHRALAALAAPPSAAGAHGRARWSAPRRRSTTTTSASTAATCGSSSPPRDAERLARVLRRRSSAHTGCAVIALPLREEYHIDLGFDLARRRTARRAPRAAALPRHVSAVAGRAPPDGRAAGGPAAGAAALRRLGDAGRPHEDEAARTARRLAGRRHRQALRRRGAPPRTRLRCQRAWWCGTCPTSRSTPSARRSPPSPAVTLCYRRARRLPDWPLQPVLHGARPRTRLAVRTGDRRAVRDRHGLHAYAHDGAVQPAAASSSRARATFERCRTGAGARPSVSATTSTAASINAPAGRLSAVRRTATVAVAESPRPRRGRN
ncbi:MAG: hypothetical protein MZW92_42970 [Comamonadaceae bacterium]|nr:hypothetical protein [Comamonadaceae bacterium]